MWGIMLQSWDFVLHKKHSFKKEEGYCLLLLKSGPYERKGSYVYK